MEPSERDERLNAYLDGEFDAAERARLEAELSESDAAEVRVRREQDEELRAALTPPPVDESALVQSIMGEVLSVPAAKPRILRPLGLLLPAAAAGFLVGYLVFGRGAVVVPEEIDTPIALAPAGRIEVITGEIRGRPPGVSDGALVGRDASIDRGTELRTSPGARCTIRLEDGSIVRLDRHTVATVIDGRTIGLTRGRLFVAADSDEPITVSLAASDSPVEIVPTGGGGRFDVERVQKAMKGPPQEEIVLRVLEGSARVGDRTVEANQVVWIADGVASDPQKRDDLVLATRWIHDLLSRESGHDRELEGRVTALVARLGRSKIEAQIEWGVRSFGDQAVPVLLRVARAPVSKKDPYQRFEAVRLACDLATMEHLPGLVELLEDRDPEVRVVAGRALRRLTGAGAAFGDGYWQGEELEAGRRFWRNWEG